MEANTAIKKRIKVDIKECGRTVWSLCASTVDTRVMLKLVSIFLTCKVEIIGIVFVSVKL
jgi:hypothetical protein